MVTDNTIRDNDATMTGPGGGLYVNASSSVTITSNLILRNQGGGGIFFQSSIATLQSNVIANNSSTAGGGGLEAQSSTLTLLRDTIANNTGNRNGGGLYIGFRSTATITDCAVNGNTANGVGGGLYCLSATTITGTTFACNTAIDGGGIYVASSGVSLTGTPGGSRNTLLGNTANRGSAIFNNHTFQQNGAGGVPASNVCWGPTGSRAPGRIHDFFIHASLAIVLDTNPITCGPFADLGAAVGSQAGMPTLTGTGPLTPGNPMTLSVASAPPTTSVALLINVSSGYTYVPLLDALIVPDIGPTSAIALLSTNPMGQASLSVPSLAWVPAGFTLYLQAIVLDNTAPNGFATLSNALVGKP